MKCKKCGRKPGAQWVNTGFCGTHQPQPTKAFQTFKDSLIPEVNVKPHSDEAYNSFMSLLAGADKRAEYIAEYGFAVLDEEALNAIVELDVPIIEVGAGRAYWASVLEERGVDIVATDIHIGKENQYVQEKPYMNVEIVDAIQAAKENPERALMIIWPSMEEVWTEVLDAYDGDTIIYVGEWFGCTATESFCSQLSDLGEEEWEIIDIQIPQWSGIRDSLTIFRR